MPVIKSVGLTVCVIECKSPLIANPELDVKLFVGDT
jgi:hypothetical protein